MYIVTEMHLPNVSMRYHLNSISIEFDSVLCTVLDLETREVFTTTIHDLDKTKVIGLHNNKLFKISEKEYLLSQVLEYECEFEVQRGYDLNYTYVASFSSELYGKDLYREEFIDGIWGTSMSDDITVMTYILRLVGLKTNYKFYDIDGDCLSILTRIKAYRYKILDMAKFTKILLLGD